MESEQNIIFKVYLKRKEEHIIRRFAMERILSNNFQYFENKIKALFPELKGRRFMIMWDDMEDMIRISSDEELVLALCEMKDRVKKVYICFGKHHKSLKDIPEIHVKKQSEAFNSYDGCHESIRYTPSNDSVSKTNVNTHSHNGDSLPQDASIVNNKQVTANDIQLTINDKEIVVNDKQIKTNDKEIMTNDKPLLTNNKQCSTDDKQVMTNDVEEDRFVFSECIDKLNHNIELVRLHLINPNGTVSQNYEPLKLKSLELTLKKLQCVVDKLINANTNETVIDSILLGDKNVDENISDVEQLNKSLAGDVEDTGQQDDGWTDIRESADECIETGSSVRTLSASSSDDEIDKWILLQEDNQESLPDVADRLKALKSSGHSESASKQTESDEQQANSALDPALDVTSSPPNSTVPASNNPFVSEKADVPKQPIEPCNESAAVVQDPPASEEEDSSQPAANYPIPPEIAVFPHLAKGMAMLYDMGFDEETHKLVELLQIFDGNVEQILDNILFVNP